MFPKPRRRSPRAMMKMYDAGGGCGGNLVAYRCGRCGYDAGWVVEDRPPSQVLRGLPCPRCNGSGGAAPPRLAPAP